MIKETLFNSQGLFSYHKWLENVGVSRPTGWRWRKQGLITTLNIAGRNYITGEEIDRFQKRAAAGEFAKKSLPGGRKEKRQT
jgi:hypothetical protein